jgi:hypothetical protein
MGLAGNVRQKVSSGELPPGIPPKVAMLFGRGLACSACEQPIRRAQVCCEFDLPGFGFFRFHFGCFGLWKADLLSRGWINLDAP